MKIPTILVGYVMDVIYGNYVKLTINQMDKLEKKRSLRSDGLVCQCVICIVARPFENEVANSKKKRGRPNSKEKAIPKPTAIKVCSLMAYYKHTASHYAF